MLNILLNACARAAANRPLWILGIGGLLTLLCGVLAALFLGMNANTDDLIAQERDYMVQYRQFLDEFGDLEYITVVLATSDSRAADRACNDIYDTLAARGFKDELYARVEADEALRLSARASGHEELNELVLARHALHLLSQGAGPAEVLQRAGNDLKRLLGAGLVMSDRRQEEVGGGAVFLLKVLAAANPHSKSSTELSRLVSPAPDPEWFASSNGRFRFINILPAKNYGTLAVIEEPLQRIRSALDEIRPRHPGVDIGLTGKPVLQADEMATSDRDMTIASILGIFLVSIPFVIAIRGLVRPALTVGAFLFGMAWTFGFATLAIGRLNLLSVVFTVILVGIGLDFGIHIVLRYLEERRTKSFADAIRTALLTTGRGNVTGALTSCSAFFMTLLTDFQGLRELGLIAGTGLIFCLLAMLTVLPALLSLEDRWRLRRGIPATFEPRPATFWMNRFDSWLWHLLLKYPGRVLAALGFLTLAALPALKHLHFEDNLLELQAQGLESVRWEHRILDESDDAVWFGALIADSEAEVISLSEAAAQKPNIGAVFSYLNIVQPMTAERAALIADLAAQPAPFAPSDIVAAPEALDPLLVDLQKIHRLAESRAPSHARLLDELTGDLKELRRIWQADPSVLDRLIRPTLTRAAASARLILDGTSPNLRDILPRALRDRFVSPNGRSLVMVHPRENIWEMSRMSGFIDDLRALDKEATGAPITHYESIFDMKAGFLRAAWLAVLMVLILLFVDYRSLTHTFLAVLPLLVGLLWTAQTMGLFGVSLNLANFFAVPILIGICTDTGVHILHRYREGGDLSGNLGSTRVGVVLTALTNILGFGCMLIAEHRGLRSLGIVMALGSSACLVSSMTLLPALLQILLVWRGKKAVV